MGAVARALANLGIRGSWRIVGDASIVDSQCRKLAKHAAERLGSIRYFPTLEAALADRPARSLSLAATARSGSPARPHPLPVRTAVQRAVEKLRGEETDALFLVFGPESDGLRNEEVALCDWVVTIPTSDEYRSLNLSQAVLLFCYEAHHALLPPGEAEPEATAERQSQRDRLVDHMLRLAEEVGFILPGDPFKMRPRLEEIFFRLPRHIQDVRTLHGLLDQIVRTVRKGRADIKGRFRQYAPGDLKE